jgi:hypothetical protein
MPTRSIPFESPKFSSIEANARLARHAADAVQTRMQASLDAYKRKEFLRSFHRLAAETIAAETREAAAAVLRELERALRAERARAGHWTYDLDRHIALLVAYRVEQARAARIAAGEAQAARRSRAAPASIGGQKIAKPK